MVQETRREKFVVAFIIAHVIVAAAAAFIAGRLLSDTSVMRTFVSGSQVFIEKAVEAVWFSSLLAQAILLGYWASTSNEHRFVRWIRSSSLLVFVFYIVVACSDLGGLDGRNPGRRAEYLSFIAALLCTGFASTVLFGMLWHFYARSWRFHLSEMFALMSLGSILLAVGRWGSTPYTPRIVEAFFAASFLAAVAQLVFCLTLATAAGRTKWTRTIAGGTLLTVVFLGIALPELLQWGQPWEHAPYAALFFGTQLLSYVPLTIWQARQPRPEKDLREPAPQTAPNTSDLSVRP